MSVFWDRLRAAGFSSYGDYLKSERWKEFKRRYRRSGLPTSCAVCGGADKIHFHHTTYERLGDERTEDVTLLCESHHDQTHACLMAEGWAVGRTADVVERLRSGESFDTAALYARRAEGKPTGGRPKKQPKQSKQKKQRGKPDDWCKKPDGKERNRLLSRLGEIRSRDKSNAFWSRWDEYKTMPIDGLRAVEQEALRLFGQRPKKVRVKSIGKKRKGYAKQAKTERHQGRPVEEVSAVVLDMRAIAAGFRRRR